MFICMSSIYIYMCKHTHTRVYIYIYTYICIYKYTHVNVYIYMCIYYINVYVNVYIYIYIYIYTYSYTHVFWLNALTYTSQCIYIWISYEWSFKHIVYFLFPVQQQSCNPAEVIKRPSARHSQLDRGRHLAASRKFAGCAVFFLGTWW